MSYEKTIKDTKKCPYCGNEITIQVVTTVNEVTGVKLYIIIRKTEEQIKQEQEIPKRD